MNQSNNGKRINGPKIFNFVQIAFKIKFSINNKTNKVSNISMKRLRFLYW